jgi:hypothetical protein
MPDTEEIEDSGGSKIASDKVVRLEERIMSSESRKSHHSSSPNRQFTLRRSIDSDPMNETFCYEVISQDDISDIQLETSINNKSVPNVKIHRLDNQLPQNINSTESIENGLVPMELDLISSSGGMASSTLIMDEEEEEEEVDDDPEMGLIEKEEVEEIEEMLGDSLLVESLRSDGAAGNSKMDAPTANTSSNSGTSSIAMADTTTAITPSTKMNREMRNLQKSTNDSKVLSNFLTVTDTPRIRGRRTKEGSLMASNENDSNDSSSISRIIDKEIPLKDSGNDSDSTVVMNDDVSKKRRKSVSRSRSRTRTMARAKSVSSRARKSVADMLSDELNSDRDDSVVIGRREEEDEEPLDENIGEAPYVAKLIENRAPNPPPKAGCDSYCFKCHADNAVLSLACQRCKCSYHRHCARLLATPIPKNPDDFVCIDCIEIEKAKMSSVNKYNHPKIDPHMLKEMLITILEKIRTYPDRDFFESDIQFKSSAKESNQPLIITQMSLKRIEERVINIYYKVSEAFLHDIKQLGKSRSSVTTYCF